MTDSTRWFRRFLLATASVVYATVVVELWLVGHVEGWRQWIPFVVVAFGLVAVGWLAVRPSRAAVAAVRVVGVVAVVTSAVGVWLHVEGNLAFAREVNAGIGTGEAVWEALSGVNPLLAPGMVALASVLAAAATYRHPAAV